MFEIDFLLLVEFLIFALVVWCVITQMFIPWRRKLPWFPAFKTETQRLSEEMEHFRSDQLEKELERARLEKREAELEAELFATRRSAEEKRKEIFQKQKETK
jgi:hypothetical protein